MGRSLRILTGCLAVWLVLAAAGCRTTPPGEPAELLAKGRRLFRAKQYGQANRYFGGITKSYPAADEAEEALYMRAETERLRGKGSTAFESYKEFVKLHPTSRFSVGVAVGEYELGVAFLKGEIPGFLFFPASRDQGVDVLEHMQVHFRNHSLAQNALIQASEYHIREKEYKQARDLLERLLTDYPRSHFRLRARYQLARCNYLMNQGPDYDGRLLLTAKRGFKDFLGTARLDGLEQTYARQMEAASA